MTKTHPNVSLLAKFDAANIAGSADIIAENVIWHFFNPRLPDLQGDYVGLAGVRRISFIAIRL